MGLDELMDKVIEHTETMFKNKMLDMIMQMFGYKQATRIGLKLELVSADDAMTAIWRYENMHLKHWFIALSKLCLDC